MQAISGEKAGSDTKLFSSLLGEISCIQEILDVLEGESVTVDEAMNLVGGIQRDIVQLFREARG